MAGSVRYVLAGWTLLFLCCPGCRQDGKGRPPQPTSVSARSASNAAVKGKATDLRDPIKGMQYPDLPRETFWRPHLQPVSIPRAVRDPDEACKWEKRTARTDAQLWKSGNEWFAVGGGLHLDRAAVEVFLYAYLPASDGDLKPWKLVYVTCVLSGLDRIGIDRKRQSLIFESPKGKVVATRPIKDVLALLDRRSRSPR